MAINTRSGATDTTIPVEPDTLLSERLLALEAEVRETRRQIRRADHRLRATWGLGVITTVAAVSFAHYSDAAAQTGNYSSWIVSRIAVLDRNTTILSVRASALETKTASMTALTDANTGQPTVRFGGVNVQIVNNTGSTITTPNGRGNLIIGYNEQRTDAGATNTRTGSHNLIVGTLQNYSNVGGAVLGWQNTISGLQSCVTGGFGNTASGDHSSVGGGQLNEASGQQASVSGGLGNIASGFYASVSGGQDNTAGDTNSSVSGGLGNVASAFGASVTGGQLNNAGGTNSCVTGGLRVRPGNASYSFGSGGQYNDPGGPGTFHSP